MSRRPGALPPVIAAALRPPAGARCRRHCDGPIVARRMASTLPGVWSVYACPSGAVSVTSYSEWTDRDPTASVRACLRDRAVPPSLVRSWDLRRATRTGPELGRRAERWLASRRPRRPVRVVYWRVYPFPGPDGAERRLFVCVRRTHPSPVFYTAPSAGPSPCPVCRRRGPARTGRPRRSRVT